MFSICTAFIENGKIKESIEEYSKAEERFTKEIGVRFRKFFQCKMQPQILWTITEWENEKAHNDAAQSIMKIRRDDRFASIAFGPAPYFEIFCYEDESIRIGDFSEENKYVITSHGLIGEKVKEQYLNIRKARIEECRRKFQWLRVYHNIYNSYEFVAYSGFTNKDKYNNVRKIGDMFLEEYVFIGLRNTLGMSYIANYNQFICEPLIF